jgi:hypothetical protein
MIFPPSPTPIPPTSTQTLSPTATATLTLTPTEVVTPTLEPIACSDDSCLDACLDRLSTVLETKASEPIDKAIGQGKEYDLVVYKVNGDEISDPHLLHVPDEYLKYQEDTEAHLRIWKFYVAFIPPELRATIKSFIIFTDGPHETTAWVSRSGGDTDYSQVGFDLLDSDYPPSLADTLVHETGHLLTLNKSQMETNETARYYYYDEKQKDFFGCEQYVADGSCSLPDSYINLFYQKFWKSSYAEWWKVEQEAQKANSSDEYWELLERKFYGKHEEWFLNPYAGTSIEEDMAESFAFFVLNPKPRRTKWVYQQKIDFYYDFPELVRYRQEMIESLCSYIK